MLNITVMHLIYIDVIVLTTVSEMYTLVNSCMSKFLFYLISQIRTCFVLILLFLLFGT